MFGHKILFLTLFHERSSKDKPISFDPYFGNLTEVHVLSTKGKISKL